MQNIHNRITGVLSIILGTIFLISSFLKAISSASFALLLYKYGVWFPEYLSPIIIITEFLLGVVLILGIRQRLTATLSTVVLFIFTIGYTFGWYFQDITDCGCFGDIHFMNSSPLWFYLRNIILLTMSLYIFFHPATHTPTNKEIILSLTAMIIGGCVIAYLTGLSSRKIYNEETTAGNGAVTISESPLNGLLHTHPDSTYLVFAFSYSCPHCLNSIANLNEYERLNVVDKVIGITRRKDNNRDFNKWFNPTFAVIEIAPNEKMIAKELPTSYYIRNDSIIHIFQGEIPCAFVFSKIIAEI